MIIKKYLLTKYTKHQSAKLLLLRNNMAKTLEFKFHKKRNSCKFLLVYYLISNIQCCNSGFFLINFESQTINSSNS